jgi:hypothetical protein
MTTPALLPVEFRVPLVNPSGGGLYTVTAWTEDNEERWLASGVQFWPVNYSGDAQFGVWDVPWCGDPGENRKEGDRPDGLPDPFAPLVVWAWDHAQCGDVRDESQTEVRERVAQVMGLSEQTAVETAFATRALADAGTPDTAADIVGAVGLLDEALAATNVAGLIHARPMWAASLAQAQLIVRSGGVFKTPLGNQMVFGSGYIDPLGDILVGTSPTFGWRGEVRITSALEPATNEYVALAEREVVVGYESAIAAVDVTG